MEKITIYYGIQGNGISFGLDIDDYEAIKQIFHDAQPSMGVFVEYDIHSNFAVHRPRFAALFRGRAGCGVDGANARGGEHFGRGDLGSGAAQGRRSVDLGVPGFGLGGDLRHRLVAQSRCATLRTL